MKTITLALAILGVFVGHLTAQAPQHLNYQGRVTADGVNFDGTGQFKFALVDGGGTGVTATATATISGGQVRAISVTNGGYGYLTPPTVTLLPLIGGSGAAASANILNGVVTSITVTSFGSGYTFPPYIIIAPPPAPVFTTYWSNDGTSILGQPPGSAVALPVTKGLYSVLLGDTTLANMTSIPASVFSNADVRLRVWFNDGENGFQLLTPDQRIGAVGYALMAASVPDGAIGVTQLADGAVTSSKLAANAVQSGNIAAGAIGSAQLAATTAQPGQVLVANAAGELMWRPLHEIVAMQDYQFQPQAFPENIAEIGITATGVGTIFGEVIHGPGFIIDRVANAHPSNSEFDYPGLNQEMDFVFDYHGPAAGALQDWHLSGAPASLTITKRDAEGVTILYVWSLQNFRLAAINPSPTGNGDRYTLVSTTEPDSILDMSRSNGDWQTDGARSSDYNAPEVEIPGITTGKYPNVTVDQSAKTITIEATYRTGGNLFQWARNMAIGIPDLRSMSLIYRHWPGLNTNEGEIGRNNFYQIFPIRYQQVSGFTPGSLPRERLVLAYGFAENVGGPSGTPLFEPPAVETFPSEGGTQVPRDAGRNRMHVEIGGFFSTNSGAGNLADMPILIQGPGYAIERDGPVNNRFSGNNRKFPFIFDLPNSSVHLPSVYTWLAEHRGQLPTFYSAQVISILGYNNGQPPTDGGTEIYRFNLFEFIPHSVTDLGDGYSRVVLHYWHPPSMLGGVESGSNPQGSDWGNATAQIDSELDRRVSISGVADFYPEITDDPETRTLTLWHNQGEGGGVFNWARSIALQGTAVNGKKDVTVYAEGGVTPVKNYFGCFPIEWQLVDGVERAAKGRARVVISYDLAEDP